MLCRPYSTTHEWVTPVAFTLTSAVEIEAPPEKVWAVLTDLDSWAAWNPFIFHAEGEPAPGSTLTLKMRDTQGSVMTFTPTVRAAEVLPALSRARKLTVCSPGSAKRSLPV